MQHPGSLSEDEAIPDRTDRAGSPCLAHGSERPKSPSHLCPRVKASVEPRPAACVGDIKRSVRISPELVDWFRATFAADPSSVIEHQRVYAMYIEWCGSRAPALAADRKCVFFRKLHQVFPDLWNDRARVQGKLVSRCAGLALAVPQSRGVSIAAVTRVPKGVIGSDTSGDDVEGGGDHMANPHPGGDRVWNVALEGSGTVRAPSVDGIPHMGGHGRDEASDAMGNGFAPPREGPHHDSDIHPHFLSRLPDLPEPGSCYSERVWIRSHYERVAYRPGAAIPVLDMREVYARYSGHWKHHACAAVPYQVFASAAGMEFPGKVYAFSSGSILLAGVSVREGCGDVATGSATSEGEGHRGSPEGSTSTW